VAEAMRYSVLGGGKRLRPLLTLAATEAVIRATGPRTEEQLRRARVDAMPAACAIELIHTFSMVHDDLPAMDNDSLRRGRPTLHVLYGDGLAILASDGLLAEAFALLAHEPSDDERPGVAVRKLRVIRRVGQAVGAAGMLGGQAMDLEYPGRIPSPAPSRLLTDPAVLRDMCDRKTGALIRAAATAGAIMAGATPVQVQAIDEYAAAVGLAFQIADDLLDVQGTTEELGKTAGKDAAAGKLTYPFIHGTEQSRDIARASVAEAARVLAHAGLPDDRLMDIARWVIDRC
jgi:geranylgeranyl diphosphate synthase type II